MMDFLRRLAPRRETDVTRAFAVLPSRFAGETPLRATVAQVRPAQHPDDDEASLSPDAAPAPAANDTLPAQRHQVSSIQPSQAAPRPHSSGPMRRRSSSCISSHGRLARTGCCCFARTTKRSATATRRCGRRSSRSCHSAPRPAIDDSGSSGLARISHSPSATTVDSGLSASLRDDFAPHHSVNYGFVAKSPCASHPSHSRLSRNEGL